MAKNRGMLIRLSVKKLREHYFYPVILQAAAIYVFTFSVEGNVVPLTRNCWLPCIFTGIWFIFVQVNYALLGEIQEINQQLIDTELHVCEEDAESFAGACEGAEGTVIKCIFTAVAVSPSLKSMFASAQMVSF